MSARILRVVRIERRLSIGNVEELPFSPGVNLIIGPPNTGKTKWLQTLDFLLGDLGDNPFEGAEETGLAEKYDAAAATVSIGGETFRIERRWREAGAKTKVFVNDVPMLASEFQYWLMERLDIPLVNFPKGNPMSGQTWPTLSFRMLLRHIYRQQRFWGDIADRQPEGEQHACLLQFLGLAERIYAEEFGQLINLRMRIERLKARREQFSQTLGQLACDIIAEPEFSVSVTASSVQSAQSRLADDVMALRERRRALLADASRRAFPVAGQSFVSHLAERRSSTLKSIEQTRAALVAAAERRAELKRYRDELANESERIARAEGAGEALSDLRITHCPACDQAVTQKVDTEHCFLCHQSMPDKIVLKELGAVRLRFERDRLASELKEADELLQAVSKEVSSLSASITQAQEALTMIERELAPAREAVSSLIQEEVSALDVALGQASERERQLSRIAGALDLEKDISGQISALEKDLQPLQDRVNELVAITDFDAAASKLEDGMNSYLNSLNLLRPNVWRHSAVTIDLSRSNFAIRVGKRRWQAALGGTDTLYFLMAYHYGLLTLSADEQSHYPGLAIIDVPGEFSGEAVEDKENFIVQPFIDLLKTPAFEDAQLIMTGASFTGLKEVQFRRLTDVFVA